MNSEPLRVEVGQLNAPLAGAISLRMSNESDMAFLLSVYADSRSEEMLKIGHWNDTEKAEFLRFQFYAQDEHYKKHYPKAEFLIIKVEDEDIGRLYVERTSKDIRVMDIALLQPHRRRGIGCKLMTDLLDEAKHHQQTVSLHVEPDNVAKQLYLKLGFSVVEEISFYEKMEWSY
ncbi:GNAT family N-acetyltransferase [Thalassotalea atypica]|uniref:GNAT family N-acetyltransferase n=1 Tax=Thalassotalea atypica TaxID=2054316 RepID=UPI0025725B4C|nr:GNAT family N-acetyltransferase [Thalassotalea atypica]